MNPIILLLPALLFTQDPDRSTPQKACENFAKFYLGIRHTESVFEQAWYKVETLADPFFTEERRKKLLEKRERSKKRREQFKTLSWSYKVGERKQNSDGSVGVFVSEKVKRRERDYEKGPEGGTKEVERTRNYRFVFVKIGTNWMVREIYTPCGRCEGKGKCGPCRGSGKGKGEECYSCKGKKICNRCNGDGFRKQNLAEIGNMGFAVAPPDKKWSTSVSSPKETAKSYADYLVRRDVDMGRTLVEFFTKILKTMVIYFTPDLIKTIKTALAEGREKGLEKYKKIQPRIEPGMEKGDTAYAVVIQPKDPSRSGPKGKDQKKRLVMKKVGNQWLIAAVQDSCWNCEGSGNCRKCKGSGGDGGDQCRMCSGKKACSTCKASGWRDSDF